MEAPKTNRDVADKLLHAADLLEQQGAPATRTEKFRHAARTIESMTDGISDILDSRGVGGLIAVDGLGGSVAAAIQEMVRTGHWALLDRLHGTLDPVRLFQGIPGVGPVLARHIHDALHVDTLEDLEIAAYDGRLAAVRGMKERRILALRASLDSILSRMRGRPPGTPPDAVKEPTVAQILDVDREYRVRATEGTLVKIAPRRFNPQNEAWLPVLHTERDEWQFTALYSNTARAHQLGRTGDWVVVYFVDGDHAEHQRTVVTETRGALTGRRVIRGREEECRAPAAA